MRHRLLAHVLRVGLSVIVVLSFAGCPPSPFSGSFQVVNAAPGVLVTELYLVKSGGPSWGSNRLATPLTYGQSVTVTGLEPDYYDEMVVAIFPESGETERIVNRAIAIQAGQTFTDTVHFVPDWPQ